MAPSSLNRFIEYTLYNRHFISIHPPNKAGITLVLEIRTEAQKGLKLKKAFQLVSGRTQTQIQIYLPLITTFYHLSHTEPD